MAEWSTTEPSNVVAWSSYTDGDVVYQYNEGSYGYRYYSRCAITRLKDNKVCVCVQVLTSNWQGYAAGQAIDILAWANDGSGSISSGSTSVVVGDGFTVKGTWYCTLSALRAGTTITVGGGQSAGQSPVTLTVPEAVGNMVFAKVGSEWKQGTPFVKVNGEWKDGLTKMKVDGEWK